MKNLIFTIVLLIGITASAQDTATINAFVSSQSLEQIKQASDKIVQTSLQQFDYYKTTDRSLREEKFKVLVYTPSSFTAEDKKEFSIEEKAQCLLVVWRVTDSGFTFAEVYNQPDVLLPFWRANFTATDNEYRVDKSLKYKYVTNENSVSIVKSY
jgi:hypothetical protein